jgi:dCTP diphosphatase
VITSRKVAMTARKNNGATHDFETLKTRLLAFRDERDWKQFHDPKNLAEAIVVEAAELLEVFLWGDPGISHGTARKHSNKIAEEAADILIFLTYLSEEVGFNLLEAVSEKIAVNEKKYPTDRARGRSNKYREL